MGGAKEYSGGGGEDSGRKGRKASTHAEAEGQEAFRDLPALGYLCVCVFVCVCPERKGRTYICLAALTRILTSAVC